MSNEVKRKRRRIDWGKEITILGFTMELGIIGILLTGITILSGISKKDVNTITQRLNTTTQELHDIKKILKKIEKRLTRE